MSRRRISRLYGIMNKAFLRRRSGHYKGDCKARETRRNYVRAERHLTRHELKDLARLNGLDETPQEREAYQDFQSSQNKLSWQDGLMLDSQRRGLPNFDFEPRLASNGCKKRRARKREPETIQLKKIEQRIRSWDLPPDEKRREIKIARTHFRRQLKLRRVMEHTMKLAALNAKEHARITRYPIVICMQG